MDKVEKPHGYLAGAFCQIVPVVQELARPLGYAVAVHGSMNRDLDLLAAPWVENPAPPAELHAAIAEALSVYSDEYCSQPVFGPDVRPHGRLSWIIPMMGGAAIDLSVMPAIRDTYSLAMEAYALINDGQPELAKRCLLEILGKIP